MKLIFLGTTGYHPNDDRHTACLMIPELGIVFDAGTAFYRVRDYLKTASLDVFLTHAHLDHTFGLTFLFDVLHERKVQQVQVHGEAEKLQAIKQHLFSPLLFPVKPPCDFRPLVGRSRELKSGAVIRWFSLDHPGGSLGYRIDYQGRSLAYVTDTTASHQSTYLSAIQDVDVLIHECYFPDGFEDRAALTGHSCATPVAEVARDCGAKRLYLIHLNPLDVPAAKVDVEAMKRIFPETYVAHDRLEIEV